MKCSLAAGLILAALSARSGTAHAESRYVFTTFLGDDVAREKLSVYTSSDGLNFKLLANTRFGGPTGVLRDPSIMKHSDGKYYVAHTVQSWDTDSKSFAIGSSSDLERWSVHTEVTALSNARHTWAPEWFVDADGVHLIVSIETGDWQFRAYDFKAKDATLTAWEAPVTIGIGPNYIDTFVVKRDGTYHAFAKNETTKYIEHATASSLHGPWTWVGKDDWAGWGSGKEGISLFQEEDGGWRMFLDCYSGCGFLYAESQDLEAWSGTKTVPGLSGVRHGTVLREELGSAAGGGAAGGSAGAGTSAGAGGAAGGTGSNLGGAGGTNRAGDGGMPSPNAGGSDGGSPPLPDHSDGAGLGGSTQPTDDGSSPFLGGASNRGGAQAAAQGGASTAGTVSFTSGKAGTAQPESLSPDAQSSGCSFTTHATEGARSPAPWLALLALLSVRPRRRARFRARR